MAMLTAMSIAATRLLGVQIGSVLRLSFGGIPIIIAGLMFGPVAGGIVGALADVIGFMINPMGGAFFPGFTLSAALTGALPPLFFGSGKHNLTALRLFVAVALTQIITNVFMNTLWIYMLIGDVVWVYFPGRVMAQAVMIPLYSVILMAVLKVKPIAQLRTSFLGYSLPQGGKAI